MTLRTTLLGIGAALVAVVFLTAATDAQARAARGRAARGRHRHHFKSAAGPQRAKTPAGNSGDAATSGPVAGAALEGDFRQSVVDGGVLLAMSPSRALLLNSYKGLTLVDTSDASSPRALASIALDGTGERMFLGAAEVAVVSDVYDAQGAHTVVTSVAIGSRTLTEVGTLRVDGSLRDAARQGDDILLVTGDGFNGPIEYLGGPAADAGGNAGVASPNRKRGGRPSHRRPHRKAAIAYPPYGFNSSSDVARVRIGADGTPSLLGTVTVAGSVLAESITGVDAVLGVQSGDSGWNLFAGVKDPSGGDPAQGTPAGYVPPVISLVRVTSDATGAPQTAGTLAIDGAAGMLAIDVSGTTARVLEYTASGETLATFDVSADVPKAVAAFALADWPSTWAFSGGVFAYATTEWNYGGDPGANLPKDPVFDPSGVANAFGGMGGMPSSGGTSTGPTSTLHVVDLSDPAKPAAGGTLDLGAGWIGGFTAVPGGVLGTLSVYDGSDAATTLFRADLSVPATPKSAASASVAGYQNLGPVLGNLLLLVGGTSDPATGAFQPSTQLVDLSSGGLVPGGSFASASWTTTAARDGNLLGVASFDRLSLVDVSDVNAPTPRGELRLVVNVAGFAALDATTGAALTTDYLGGDVEIRTVSLPAADALAPLDTIKVATGDAQMFAAAPFLYVVATDWSTGRASVEVVDATNPAHLVLRGSLDLASYPGQVFRKGSTLLLLREAYSLFQTDENGSMSAVSDAFGKCPRSLLRRELGAVLDVVNLSDPDAPSAGRRVRLDFDSSGAAILDGDSLYVPSYVDVTGPNDEYSQYAYQVREVDVSNPLAPSAHAPVDVPGTIVAAAGAARRILTSEYSWDGTTGQTTSTLHLVDLSRGWRSRVVASRTVDGYPDTVAVAGGRAYVATETWGGIVYAAADAQPAQNGPSAHLLTFNLSEADMVLTSSANRDRGAYGSQVAAGCLFLRSWGWTGSLDVYSLATPGAPVFIASKDVAGLAGDVTVTGGRAYVPGGLYGIQSFDLSK